MNPRKPPSTPPIQTPKYLNDFSKALAGEVRILLEEVGKLRDERRALQFEIAELQTLKAKHSPGGEYAPRWLPQITTPPQAPTPAIELPPSELTEPRPGGWRIVHKRPERRPKVPKSATPAPRASAPEPPRIELPAWQSWRPNPLLAPTPVQANMQLPHAPSPPSQSGLFGPPTPPPL